MSPIVVNPIVTAAGGGDIAAAFSSRRDPVEFDRELKSELERVAPDWNWICESRRQGPFSEVQVYGKHKSRGILTMPFSFQRPPGPTGSPRSLAEFICRSLSNVHGEKTA